MNDAEIKLMIEALEGLYWQSREAFDTKTITHIVKLMHKLDPKYDFVENLDMGAAYIKQILAGMFDKPSPKLTTLLEYAFGLGQGGWNEEEDRDEYIHRCEAKAKELGGFDK